jgi:hypothetical protein
VLVMRQMALRAQHGEIVVPLFASTLVGAVMDVKLAPPVAKLAPIASPRERLNATMFPLGSEEIVAVRHRGEHRFEIRKLRVILAGEIVLSGRADCHEDPGIRTDVRFVGIKFPPVGIPPRDPDLVEFALAHGRVRVAAGYVGTSGWSYR